jgi:uncharacterized protein (TIGR02145 family)
MKKSIKIITVLICTISLLQINAQYLGNSSYQIVLRNEKNQLIAKESVDLKITILNATIIKYEEVHSVTTNINGLASITLGKGMVIYGGLENINLSNGAFFVKSEYKRKNETTYKTIETNQLMSVPNTIYASNGIPTGATNGQILTFCEGKPQWRDYGQCQCPTNLIIKKCPTNLDEDKKLLIGLNSEDEMLSFTIEIANDKCEDKDWTIWPDTRDMKLISTTDSNLIAKGGYGKYGNKTFYLQGIPTVKGKDSTSFIFKIKELTCKATFAVIDPENLTKPGNGVTDKFGNKYKTIIVGKDEWMAENLIVSKYTNDSEFPEHINAFIIDTLTKFDNETMKIKYNLENVCPNGWSIPSDEDWENLSNHFDSSIINKKYGFIPKGVLYKDLKIETNNIGVITSVESTSEILDQENGFWWTSNREIDLYNSNNNSNKTFNNMVTLDEEFGLENYRNDCYYYYNINEENKNWQNNDLYYGKFNIYHQEIVRPRANVRCIKNK